MPFVPLMVLIHLPMFIAGGTLLWLGVRISRRCRETGRCLNCGYDLTGTSVNICAECGCSVHDTLRAQCRSATDLAIIAGCVVIGMPLLLDLIVLIVMLFFAM